MEKKTGSPETGIQNSKIPKFQNSKILIIVGFFVLLNLMYPNTFPRKFTLQVGDVAKKDIIAPFTFYVQKNKTELQKEMELVKQSVFPVIRKAPDISQNIQSDFNGFFDELESIRADSIPMVDKRAKLLSIVPTLQEEYCDLLLRGNYKTVRDTLSNIIDGILEQGIISYKPITSSIVTLITPDDILKERPINISGFVNYDNLSYYLKEEITPMFKNIIVANTIIELGTFFIKPNLILDSEETLKRTKSAINQIKPTKGIVLKDEIIVRAHDIVTEEMVEKVNSLPQTGKISRIRLFLGINIIYLIALSVLFLCIYFLNSALLKEFNKIILLLLLLCVVMGISSIIIFSKISLYFIPVATFGILVSLLLGQQIGIIGVVTLTILLATYSYGEFELMILSLFVGILSVFVSKNVKKSFDFYKALVYIAGGCVCIALGIETMKLTPLVPLMKSIGWAALGGGASTFIAFAFLPLFERGFRLTTQIALTSYADLDHPMLQRLATYASGTYHHSLTVANLAEAAARTINANPLLARVGAYYHDIGKLRRPNYFIENQKGKDPHANLKPELNAFIIISHVKEGVLLARQEGLPEDIIEIIASHHGTTVVSPFYIEAKEHARLAIDTETNELDFRYKGPLPATKESAIVMLADAVEATARSLDDPEPTQLKGVIEDTVKRRMDDGQLSKVDLSMDELEKVEKVFLPILMGIFHPRIDYEKSIHKKNNTARNKAKEET